MPHKNGIQRLSLILVLWILSGCNMTAVTETVRSGFGLTASPTPTANPTSTPVGATPTPISATPTPSGSGVCSPLLNGGVAANSTLQTSSSTLMAIPASSTSVSASSGRRVVAYDFLNNQPVYLAFNQSTMPNGGNTKTLKWSYSSSGNLVLNGTIDGSQNTIGGLEFQIQDPIVLPPGTTKLILMMTQTSASGGQLGSPQASMTVNGTRSAYNLTPAGSTACPTSAGSGKICTATSDYIVSLSGTTSYALNGFTFLTSVPNAGGSGSFTVEFNGLSFDTSSSAIYTDLVGFQIAREKWSGALSIDTPSASTLTVLTALYPYNKEGTQNSSTALSNGLVPVPNVDSGSPTHVRKITVNAPAGHSSLALPVAGVGPGEYVYQVEVSGPGGTIRKFARHVTITRNSSALADSFFGADSNFWDSQDLFANNSDLQSVRTYISWNMLDRSTNQSFNVSQWPWYDGALRRFASAGMKMHVDFLGMPAYLSSKPLDPNAAKYAPADLVTFSNAFDNVDYRATAYYKFVKAFVTANRPWLASVEIGNEYDANECYSWEPWYGSFAGIQYDCTNANGGGGTAQTLSIKAGSMANRSQEYMELLRAGYMAVKDVDLNLPVSHLGLAVGSIENLKAMAEYVYYDGKKGSDFIDFFNIHQYWDDKAPETATGMGNQPYEQYLASIVTLAKSYNKPLQLTEFGFDDTYSTPWNGAGPVTRRTQTLYTTRAFMMMKKAGLQKAYMFTSTDLSGGLYFGGMGFTDVKDNGKDLYAAFQNIVSQFSGFIYVKTIDKANHRIEVFRAPGTMTYRAFIYKKTDNGSGQDSVTFTANEMAGFGVVRRLTPLVNVIDQNVNAASVTQNVPFLNPLIVEVGSVACQ